MNIFATYSDPHDSAFALDDKRAIKMILESAQLMSTAINLSGGKAPYKTTHPNHPVSIWARQNNTNYWWLFEHYQALCQVYYDRFNKRHKTLDYILEFRDGVFKFPKSDLTPFANCTEFKNIKDVHEAYRLQLNKKWANDKRNPKWTNAKPPEWAKL